jgi:hypothetical protein
MKKSCFSDKGMHTTPVLVDMQQYRSRDKDGDKVSCSIDQTARHVSKDIKVSGTSFHQPNCLRPPSLAMLPLAQVLFAMFQRVEYTRRFISQPEMPRGSGTCRDAIPRPNHMGKWIVDLEAAGIGEEVRWLGHSPGVAERLERSSPCSRRAVSPSLIHFVQDRQEANSNLGLFNQELQAGALQ